MCKRKHFILFLFSLLFISCEKQVQYDYNDFEQKIVVDCFVENGKCTLFLSKNLSTLAPDTIVYIEGSTVTINNTLLIEQDKRFIHTFTDLREGDELNLKITKAQFPEATAHAVIPANPQFSIVSAKRVSDTNYRWDDRVVELEIQLNDVKKNTPDIYMIELRKTKMALDVNYDPETGVRDEKMRKYNWMDVFYIEDNAANIVDNGDLDFRFNNTDFTLEDDMVTPYAWIVADKTFDGQNKTLTLYCQHDFSWTNFEIRVSTINNGYYEFIQSVAAYDSNSQMFNEPVHIKSNINNGLGFFAVKVTAIDSIKINDIK